MGASSSKTGGLQFEVEAEGWGRHGFERKRLRTHIHTQTHIHRHTHTDTHTQTHTHTDTHTPLFAPSFDTVLSSAGRLQLHIIVSPPALLLGIAGTEDIDVADEKPPPPLPPCPPATKGKCSRDACGLLSLTDRKTGQEEIQILRQHGVPCISSSH